MTSLIHLPSFEGLIPMLAILIAFSISLTDLGSKGLIKSVLGSGTEMFEMFLSGVGIP